jgi:hypothetical protein
MKRLPSERQVRTTSLRCGVGRGAVAEGWNGREKKRAQRLRDPAGMLLLQARPVGDASCSPMLSEFYSASG